MRSRCLLVLLVVGISISKSKSIPDIKTEIPESTEIDDTSDCEVDLDFSDMGLNVIRRNFVSGLSIKSLALRNNSIQNFQASTFDSLPNLMHLDISNNQISKEYLFSFGPVPSLRSLILDNNSIIDRDDYRRSWRCSDNEYYSVRYDTCVSRYSALQMNVEFPEVTHLSLRNISMDSISNYWSYKFPKIEYLDVSNNNLSAATDDFFQKLPSTIKNLSMEYVWVTSLVIKTPTNITSLNLNLNRFEIISSNYCYERTLCLKNLNNLENLLVAGCSIKRIEYDAFKDSQKLTHLDISNNSLSEIPDGAFGPLSSLSFLDLSQNSFFKIPDISVLKNLKTLKMNEMRNELVLVDLGYMASMPSIQVISLQGNRIRYIPETFFAKLQGLQEIDLSDNQLATLTPGSWQMNLKKIHLRQNRISAIEDLQLNQATSLELLDLERNNITDIKLSVVRNLPDTVLLKV